ncbi:MAG: tetratricopeptide repeat protein [bacterium]|nr:tetratricopeptide repeat protein [bacterium]
MDICLKFDEVEALIAGELSTEDKERFEAHLASCLSCRKTITNRKLTTQFGLSNRQDCGKTVDFDPDMTCDSGSGADPAPANHIEGYDILHEIHRGGQGVVYKAVQLATKRTVALKVLLHGPFASAKQQHRFEREIDLIASIQHPNIVTVYDSGLAQGRYYFAMEYIHGHSLDEYLKNTTLDTKAKLRLFRKICSAVNSAHQRGVIHRDLKPGNIRVNAEGEPHVLDFGLAKAAGPDIQDGQPVTVLGEFMGTLAYASPEHTCGDPRLIDTRADVYSLGMILYEMLTGDFPYGVVGHVAEVLGNIAKVEPRRPASVNPRIDNEIETIVLKTLAKEKERRYQSAHALSRDVGRYLAGEPLDAKRNSPWYVLRKSLRRYRLAVGVIAAFILILTGSTFALSIMYQNQSRARREAEAAQIAEEVQRTLAEERADELEILTEFQQSMLSDIDVEAMGQALYGDLRSRIREALEAEGLSPEESESAAAGFERMLLKANATDVALNLMDKQVLDRAVRAIGSDFIDQPLVRAALQQTVAETYCRIGRFQPAKPLQESALSTRRAELGDDHQDTLKSIDRMGYLLESMGRFDEAHTYYEEGLEGRRRTLGNDHPETLAAINNMGLIVSKMGRLEEAQVYYREALEGYRRVLGNDDVETLTSVLNMGSLLKAMEQYDEALIYFNEALVGNRRVLGDNHPNTLVVINNLGDLYHALGRLDEAESYFREVLEIRRRINGDDHPETLVSFSNMASLLIGMGKYEEALKMFREVLAGSRRTLGDDHPNTLVAISYVGILLKKLGNLEEAEPYFRESLEGNRRMLGDDHPSTITSIHNMGRLLRDLGQFEEAAICGAQAVNWARETQPERHQDAAAFLASYGVTLSKLERFDEASAALLEAYDRVVALVGESHRHTIGIVRAIIDLYDTRHAAEPDGGYDAEAAAWRARLASSTDEPAAD